MKPANYIVILIFLGIVGFYVWNYKFRNDFTIPHTGDIQTKKVLVNEQNGTIVNGTGQKSSGSIEDTSITSTIEREIYEVNGDKYTIPPNEILRGCHRKDCIPSIDSPQFETISQANAWLDDAAPGIAYGDGAVQRFYPYDILISHEIVNDEINGHRVLISYCPLCLTAVVFKPVVNRVETEFGVSGRLWKSNLIMYDRLTDTLWSQVLGEAINGDLAGTLLPKLPSDQILYGKWKKSFPKGEVLSAAAHGSSQYGNFYTDSKSHFEVSRAAKSFAQPTDTRLPDESHVFGIVVKGKARAYPVSLVKMEGVINDHFQDKNIELRYIPDLDIVRMFEILPDKTEVRINPLSGFWFSWSLAHPETSLYLK